MTCETLQGKYAEKLEREIKKMDKEIELLYKKLDAQDKIIDEQAQKYSRLLEIARKMHLWIFLNADDEQKVYDELEITDDENVMLGYSGQMILGDKENE